MGETEAELPKLDLSTGTAAGVCEDCHHPAVIDPRRPSFIRSVLRMGPRPAECPVRVEDVSGLGTLSCGCRSPQHGS